MRTGTLPALELYMTLEREVEEGHYILERSADGMDFTAGAYFRRVLGAARQGAYGQTGRVCFADSPWIECM